MKNSNLSKLVGAGVLAASVALVPLTLPASAQTNNTAPDTTTTTAPSQGVDNTNNEGDRDFDWGWLGLLGLAGLAGLAGRKNNEPTAYRDPNEVGSSTSRR
ncbi:WGxxGxxG family protein [Coleofasciculus sp. H7-2]|uniref:WGxxGxxG family protein n=1 Tax=Coleofasciculus sp. H7-2 TaxID=3351545 RepID=UPI0036730833